MRFILHLFVVILYDFSGVFVRSQEAVSDSDYVIQQNILTACTHLKRFRDVK
jgi:hypothetical protein